MLSAAACTLGCKVNQCDTDALLARLSASGYAIRDFSEPAGLYLVNTCAVTRTAESKSRRMIRRARQTNPRARVVVCGCMARLSPEAARAAGADAVFSARDPEAILAWLAKAPPDETGDAVFDTPETKAPPRPAGRTRAFIKIQDGCDRYCTYCVVPYARGPAVSRPPDEVLAEIKTRVSQGAREVVLTGVHIASYGRELAGASLPGLMREAAAPGGPERVRLGSIDPAAVDGSFLDAVRDRPGLCGHFHLSLQSGCARTLVRMNRRYTPEAYAEAARLLRAVRPGAALTTDVIVGFPGETDADFFESLRFVESMGFARVHVFEYSPRPGTPAAGFPEAVPPGTRRRRSGLMRERAALAAGAYLESFTGQTLPVLFETKKNGYWEGHTANYIAVRVRTGAFPRGRVLNVKLLSAAPDGVMDGELV